MTIIKTKFVVIFVTVCAVILLLHLFILPYLKVSTISNCLEKSATQSGLAIDYPYNGTIFPPDIAAPEFLWSDSNKATKHWLISISFEKTGRTLRYFTDTNKWQPARKTWNVIKKYSQNHNATVSITGHNNAVVPTVLSHNAMCFTTSPDSVRDPVFYREVILPFSEAVKDPSRIRWRFGSVSQEKMPPVVLENLPVCGNCHSFSANGKVIGMDVDYANDKGAYTITNVAREMNLVTSDIMTWSDYKRDEKDPTFGLLSSVSPNGQFVVSTVKDRSVFVAKPDLCFSQLFFPIQGILAVYNRQSKTFAALPGASDTSFVQSNATWSPDGSTILFAKSKAYHLKNLRDKSKALLSPAECDEFLSGVKQFKFDVYRIPFNNGNGGIAEPLPGASNNGMSNYFARYSPNGKWIVFCQSNSFMLLQPDSKLYIMPACGGTPRLMSCNLSRMNSWHSWSSNSKWLVFSSKANSPYTQLFITHIDDNGNDAPPVLLDRFISKNRAANIPEFVNTNSSAIAHINPKFIDDVSLWRAGMAFWEAHDLENAKLKFQEALRLNNANVKAYVAIGNICEQQNDMSGAFDAYTNAVKADFTSALAKINLGNIFLRQEKYEQAITQYTAALRLSPQDMYAHYNLAEAYQKSGLINQAIGEFRKAQAIAPDDALTCFELGKAYEKIGSLKEALNCYKKTVMLDPGFKQAVDSIAALRKAKAL